MDAWHDSGEDLWVGEVAANLHALLTSAKHRRPSGCRLRDEEVRFDKAQVELLSSTRKFDRKPYILTAAEEIPLAEGNMDDRALKRREAGVVVQIAGRLLLDFSLDDGPVGVADTFGFYLNGLEKSLKMLDLGYGFEKVIEDHYYNANKQGYEILQKEVFKR